VPVFCAGGPSPLKIALWSVALAVAHEPSRSPVPGDSNLKNWNFGTNAIFFNADKDLARSNEVLKLEFRMSSFTYSLKKFQFHPQIPKFQFFGTDSSVIGILESVHIRGKLGTLDNTWLKRMCTEDNTWLSQM
jgi:hypothetical protein